MGIMNVATYGFTMVAARTLGEHLGASRAFYAEVDGEQLTIARDFCDGGPSVAGTYALTDYGPATRLAPGLSIVAEDVLADSRLTADERAACERAMAEFRGLAEDRPPAEQAKRARVNLVQALLNHNDFVTVR